MKLTPMDILGEQKWKEATQKNRERFSDRAGDSSVVHEQRTPGLTAPLQEQCPVDGRLLLEATELWGEDRLREHCTRSGINHSRISY